MTRTEAAALLGYTGGAPLRAVAGSDEDLQAVERRWRRANPALVKFWGTQGEEPRNMKKSDALAKALAEFAQRFGEMEAAIERVRELAERWRYTGPDPISTPTAIVLDGVVVAILAALDAAPPAGSAREPGEPYSV